MTGEEPLGEALEGLEQLGEIVAGLEALVVTWRRRADTLGPQALEHPPAGLRRTCRHCRHHPDDEIHQV